jgi:hypothetical protein
MYVTENLYQSCKNSKDRLVLTCADYCIGVSLAYVGHKTALRQPERMVT